MRQYKIIKLYTLITISLFIFSSCTKKQIVRCNDSKKLQYTETCCPIIGNTDSNIFHVPGGQYYKMMLKKNKTYENRKCFSNKSEAKSRGFRESKI